MRPHLPSLKKKSTEVIVNKHLVVSGIQVETKEYLKLGTITVCNLEYIIVEIVFAVYFLENTLGCGTVSRAPCNHKALLNLQHHFASYPGQLSEMENDLFEHSLGNSKRP